MIKQIKNLKQSLPFNKTLNTYVDFVHFLLKILFKILINFRTFFYTGDIKPLSNINTEIFDLSECVCVCAHIHLGQIFQYFLSWAQGFMISYEMYFSTKAYENIFLMLL